MLQPSKQKYRKFQKGRTRGKACRCCNLSFGDFGLQAMTTGRITARQIEAARMAMSRAVKRGGKLWIRIFPHKAITKKPAETRMGKGKGAPEEWVAPIKRGTMLYEMMGVPKEVAVEALKNAGHKLPVGTKVIIRSEEGYHECR